MVESLEKLTTSKEVKREEVSSSFKDVEKPEGERISMLKSEELNEGLEVDSRPFLCIIDEDQGISTASQNTQV